MVSTISTTRPLQSGASNMHEVLTKWKRSADRGCIPKQLRDTRNDMMINLGRYKFTLLEFVVSNNAHTFLSCILDFHVQLCFFVNSCIQQADAKYMIQPFQCKQEVCTSELYLQLFLEFSSSGAHNKNCMNHKQISHYLVAFLIIFIMDFVSTLPYPYSTNALVNSNHIRYLFHGLRSVLAVWDPRSSFLPTYGVLGRMMGTGVSDLPPGWDNY